MLRYVAICCDIGLLFFLDTSLISLLEQQLESSRRDSETLLNRPATGMANPAILRRKEIILEKENRTIDRNVEEQKGELFLQFR